MTQDEIIEMARQARMHRNKHNLASNPVQYSFSYDGTEEALIAFAKLVAAKEREACAKVVDDIEWKCITDDVDDPPLKEVVKAIRARGEA